jgi:hypothetical protein
MDMVFFYEAIISTYESTRRLKPEAQQSTLQSFGIHTILELRHCEMESSYFVRV